MHGVTKSITFPATITVKDGSASLKTEFALNRKDFGIAYAGKADDLIRDVIQASASIPGFFPPVPIGSEVTVVPPVTPIVPQVPPPNAAAMAAVNEE